MMTPKDLQSRLPWRSPRPSGIGGHLPVAAIVLALAMVFVVLVSGGAQACRDNALVGAGTAVVAETQAVEKMERKVLHAIPRGVDLRRTHEIRATGTEGNALDCCGTPHVSGSGCSGANCVSCSAAAVPTAIAAYVPGTASGCRGGPLERAAALSPASLFRPPRLDV